MPASTGEYAKNYTIYRSLVDQFDGFYRVYNATSGKAVPYSNYTLNINNGDIVAWLNDGVPDSRLTIISSQKLWDNNTGDLKWAYKQFSYAFNKSGTYEVYIRQYPDFRQKIVVGQIKSSSVRTMIPKSTTKVTKISAINVTTPKHTIKTTTHIAGTTVNTTKSDIVSTIINYKRLNTLILFTILLLLVYLINKKVKE